MPFVLHSYSLTHSYWSYINIYEAAMCHEALTHAASEKHMKILQKTRFEQLFELKSRNIIVGILTMQAPES